MIPTATAGSVTGSATPLHCRDGGTEDGRIEGLHALQLQVGGGGSAAGTARVRTLKVAVKGLRGEKFLL